MNKLFGKIFKDFGKIHWIVCTVLTILCIVWIAASLLTLRGSNIYSADFRAIQHSVDPDGTQHHQLRGISLRKGTYDVLIGYVSDSDASIDISLDNDIFRSETLPSTDSKAGSVKYTFELETGTDRGKIDFTYPTASRLDLAYITVVSDKPLYYDGVVGAVIVFLIIPCIWLGMYFFIHSTHKISLLVAVSLVIAQIIPFMFNSELHLGIDTRAHMMRIEGIYYGLLDGQFPVVIYPEWNNSYGQLGVLYPNVFLYIPAVFRLMGVSQLGACKLFLCLTICISAVVALASARTIFKREWQITIAIFAICLDNTHIIDMLSAGRIGGAVLAEIFYPLVVAGLIEVFYRNRNKWHLLAYGVAGVFCCHVMSATIVCIAVAVFTICSWKKLRESQTLHAIGRAIMMFSGLVLGTAACFIKFYFGDWGQDNLQWKSLLSTLWPLEYGLLDRRWLFAGALIFVALIAIIILIVRKRYDLIRNDFIIPSVICGVVLFWMSTVAFPWKILARIPAVNYYASMVQSAHRFLALADSFLTFGISGLLENVVISKENRRSYESRTVIVACALIGILCAIDGVTGYYSYFVNNKTILYYDKVLGEVESTAEDYLPAGTLTEWYATDTGYISDESAVSSLAYERKGTYVYYSYTNSKEGAYVEFPRFYYDGYVAEDEMAEPIEVVKGDHNRTRVYLKVTETPDIVRMWYHVPWYMTLACAFSFGLWIGSLMVVIAKVYRRID